MQRRADENLITFALWGKPDARALTCKSRHAANAPDRVPSKKWQSVRGVTRISTAPATGSGSVRYRQAHTAMRRAGNRGDCVVTPHGLC
jgi:hypothetical protein